MVKDVMVKDVMVKEVGVARPAPAVNRALQLVDLLVSHPTDRFTISQLARRTGMSLGSAHAVLAVLETSGYVTRHPHHKTYALGPALVAAGIAALEQLPAIQAATDQIRTLATELHCEAAVTAATGTEIIFVSRAGQPSPHAPAIREGERVPLVPPLGSVFLAWSDRDEVAAWLSRARVHDDVERERGQRMLAAVRTRGYAVSLASSAQRAFGDAVSTLTDDPRRIELRDELDQLLAAMGADGYELDAIEPTRTYDIGMIAAPVFDGESRVLASIVAIGLAPGLSAAQVLAAGERVRDSAVVVTKQTRGRLPA